MIEQIKADRHSARLAKDAIKASLLTTLVGEYETNVKRSGSCDLTALIKKFVKDARSMLEVTFSEHAVKEIEILESYLPKQLTSEELTAILTELVEIHGTKIGSIMGSLKIQYNGLYDGQVAMSILKEISHSSK